MSKKFRKNINLGIIFKIIFMSNCDIYSIVLFFLIIKIRIVLLPSYKEKKNTHRPRESVTI